eukprot:15434739-Alexandrium_andersonii.AAC.1
MELSSIGRKRMPRATHVAGPPPRQGTETGPERLRSQRAEASVLGVMYFASLCVELAEGTQSPPAGVEHDAPAINS